MRQNLSKRLKARQMCVDDDDENAVSKKPPLLIAQEIQSDNAHNTQHKLGVAFCYLERNNSNNNKYDYTRPKL